MEVTFLKILEKLGHLAVFLLAMVAFLYYYDFNEIMFFPVIVGGSALVLPSLYLFFEHYYFSKNKKFVVNNTGITVSTKNSKVFYPIEKLSEIIIYRSRGMEKGSFPLITFELFYYALIITKDKQEIILTSMLYPKFDSSLVQLKGVPVEIYRTFFASILYP